MALLKLREVLKYSEQHCSPSSQFHVERITICEFGRKETCKTGLAMSLWVC